MNNTFTNCFFLSALGETYKACLNFCKFENHINERSKSFLHHVENDYFKTLTYEQRINSYLLGRYSAKKAISALIDERDLKKIQIKNGVFNQPIVICEGHNNIHVSLTHSGSLAAAIAFNDLFVLGIDIEKMDPHISDIIEIELTQHEKDLTCEFSSIRESFLLMLWTIKESLSKALKTGLTIPLKILEVKSVNVKDGYFVSTFTNFFQYHSISWIINDYAFAITYPKGVKMDWDIDIIKQNVIERLRHSED